MATRLNPFVFPFILSSVPGSCFNIWGFPVMAMIPLSGALCIFLSFDWALLSGIVHIKEFSSVSSAMDLIRQV